MSEKLAYGTWPSPLGAELLAKGGTRLGAVGVFGDEAMWLESRPSEAGRSVLVGAKPGTEPADRLPSGYSARSRVHEYGGGAWWPGASHLYFVNWDDQRIYRYNPHTDRDRAGGAPPEAITPEPTKPGSWRYADGAEHPDGTWLACVREDHHGDGEPINALVSVPTDGSSEPVLIASASDFVSTPRFSSDGRWLSWIRWNHPNMPWGATELCVAPVDNRATPSASIGDVRTVAVDGESIHGADWVADGRLIFSTDRNGYWNLHAWSPDEPGSSLAITDLHSGEIGAPPWGFGTKRWAELADGRLMAVVTTDAADSLLLIDPSGGTEPVPAPDYRSFSDGVTIGPAAGPAGMLAVAAGPKRGSEVVEITPDAAVVVHRPADDLGVDPAWFSEPETIDFDAAHAFYYRPHAPGIEGLDGELPPLVVVGHGGPTGHSSPALDLKVQYWTTRGFGVVDVNYRGSTGFGRAYRDLLAGQWGVIDVEDCVGAARHLAAAGAVDPARLVIRGSSAGGLTVLLALISSDMFAAGTSLYGVADLQSLATDTHKFESRYLDGLIGRYPEQKQIYQERSPVNHTERLRSPMLIMQGTDDMVVPPSQSEAIVEALAANGVPHAYVPFDGEQHGFRQAANIERSFELELWFYAELFGLALPSPIESPAEAVGFGA